jgi:hypothetical protein
MKVYKSEFIERMLVPSCQECPHRKAYTYFSILGFSVRNRDKYKSEMACSAITRTRLGADGLTVSYHPPISQAKFYGGLFLPDCPLEDAGPGSDCGTSATARTDNG